MKYIDIDYRTWSHGRNLAQIDHPTLSWEEVIKIGRKGCEANDTTLLDEAIAFVEPHNIDFFLDIILSEAIGNNALVVLSHLVNNHGVRFHNLETSTVVTWPLASTTTLEYLLAHGWDINSCRGINSYRNPFLWHVTSDKVLVQWCLDYGARVEIAGVRTRPLLEKAAANGSFATFKLLQSAGATIGTRTLHLAIQAAVLSHTGARDSEKDTEAQRQSKEQQADRTDLVRYLIDVVGLDVNAPDWKPGNMPFSGHGGGGTPICYVIDSFNPEWLKHARDLTWLLLDRGADPTPALLDANKHGMILFVEYVDAWREKRHLERAEEGWSKAWSQRGCCAQ
jgi:hypothetical protein